MSKGKSTEAVIIRQHWRGNTLYIDAATSKVIKGSGNLQPQEPYRKIVAQAVKGQTKLKTTDIT